MTMVSTEQSAASAGTATKPCFSAESFMERREFTRQAQPVPAHLLPLGSSLGVQAVSDDISEGGMHLTVPVGFGIAVGQRCEVSLTLPATESNQRSSTRCYATVVRTRISLGDQQAGDREDRVGVGLRFDRPLYL
jgi:hypothetical protein